MTYNLSSRDDAIATKSAAQQVGLEVLGSGTLDLIASRLYRIATMLVGPGEQSIELIEQVLAQLDLAHCRNQDEAKHKAHLTLGGAAITLLSFEDAASLAAPDSEPGPVTCIEDDDLDSVGVSAASFESFLHGADDAHLRSWLESLPIPLRVTFVLHAVAGLSFTEVGTLLVSHGGPQASEWTSDSVRGIFRLGLCSLASQLIQAAVSS